MLCKLRPRWATGAHRQLRPLATYREPHPCGADSTQTSLVLVSESRRFINDCLLRVGVPAKKLRCFSDLMLAADYRGIHGCGINRLELYLRDIQQGYVNVRADPEILNETAVSAHVDGKHALGVVVGNFCMDLAVEKARQTGIGFVVAKRSNHIGMAAWYAFRAMAEGYVGLVLSNSAPTMMAPGAKLASIGANCLAFGARANQSHFMLDMSLSVKDFGDLEWAFMKDERIPDTWAADDCGVPTGFPSLALKAQRLFPAGGAKGFCLAAMIDMLCGVMSGAKYSTQIPRWWSDCQGHSPDLGLIMLALDPSVFVPNFKDRLDDFHNRIEYSLPLDGENPVKLPGELERQHMQYVNNLGAVPYPYPLLAKFKLIADLLYVKPIELAFMSSTGNRCN